ncbi:MAG: NRDE family protein [Bacteroidota bacterium]
MCLILFAYRVHPDYQLILAANRDEFYERPTARADWWDSDSNIFAGRDLKGGGTWMGVNRKGGFAAVTNYREVPGEMAGAPTRGDLVADFLRKTDSPADYLATLGQNADQYNGFNLIVGDQQSLWYVSNRGEGAEALKPGVYGLSNHLLNTPWPKVEKGMRELKHLIRSGNAWNRNLLFDMLSNAETAPDDTLPKTGVPLAWERILAPMFIRSKAYGTRVSTILLITENGEVSMEERAHVPEGKPVRIHFSTEL